MPRESTPLVRKSGFLEAEKFYVLAYEVKLKNSEFYRFPPILSKEKSSFFLQMIRSVLGDFILYGLN